MDKEKENLSEVKVVQTREIKESDEKSKEESMNGEELKKEVDTSTQIFGINSTISSVKMSILNVIKNGLINLQSEINLDKYVQYISNSKAGMNYYFETLYEYPELFYPDLTVSCVYYTNKNGTITRYSLKVKYLYPTAVINTMKSNLAAKVKEIKDYYLYNAVSIIEKEYIIHDYLLENCTYNTSTNLPTSAHTSYAALITGSAVCDGYSKAAKLLFNECGIDSGIISSDSMNHAWNYIKINGYYYFLDITWDDPIPENFISRYSYFNRSTNEMRSGNHIWITANYPSSTSTTFSFLRGYSKLTRSNDFLFYYDVNAKSLYRMTLEGKNKVVIRTGFSYKNSLELLGYDNNLYYVRTVYDNSTKKNYDTIIRYNLSNKVEASLFRTVGVIKKIYKKNTSLIVQYTASQSTSTINTTTLSINIEGDTNRDGLINITDVNNLATKNNKKTGEAGYLLAFDFNKDGIIDVYDIVKIASKI